jgi:23S rRNA G2445 N2-methylase RlmL
VTYYSTFPSGLEQIAADAIAEPPLRARIISLLDGAALYHSEASPTQVARLGFAQNSFLVLRAIPKVANPPMDRLLEAAAEVRIPRPFLSMPTVRRATTFRLVTSLANRLVSPNKRLRGRLEGSLATQLRKRVERSGADLEFWLSVRREGMGFFGLRLTTRRGTEAKLHPGELRPELAYLLCLMCNPAREHCFLDPFCGYGGIVMERFRAFPAREIHGKDSDPDKVGSLRKRIDSLRADRCGKPKIAVGSAADLGEFATGSVDEYVTDPPWGAYESEDIDLAPLYAAAVSEAGRVLSERGVGVFLVGRDGPMEEIMESHDSVRMRDRYDILVSGRKATVLRFGRRAGSVQTAS